MMIQNPPLGARCDGPVAPRPPLRRVIANRDGLMGKARPAPSSYLPRCRRRDHNFVLDVNAAVRDPPPSFKLTPPGK
jgi:hypothetical protein